MGSIYDKIRAAGIDLSTLRLIAALADAGERTVALYIVEGAPPGKKRNRIRDRIASVCKAKGIVPLVQKEEARRVG